MRHSLTFAALAAAAGVVFAEQEAAAYGQCGGQNYQGPTACESGYHCNAYNDFYSQCIPGAASSSAVAAATSKTAVSAGSSIASSVEVVSSVASSTEASSSTVVASASTEAAASVQSSISSTLATKVAVTTSVAAVNSSSTKAASTASTVAAGTSAGTASASYPTTSGTQFVIDGKAGYYAGTNSYWIGFLTNNSDVDLVMQQLSESGLKILRVWGFNDVTTTPSDGTVYFQSFAGSEPVINTGSDGLERLDYVVKSAEAHGIKLIINFVNQWTDYGGMAAYFDYAGISDNAHWYNSTLAQTQYQKYIKAVVSRYTNSSSIFAWELANEPRCTGCDLSELYTWISTTAKYIKTLDPNRMVTTGEEGFGLSTGDDGSYPYTTGAGGSNFTANCAIEEIDFCTYHLYPESWSVTPTQEWGNEWIKNHAAACASVGKPCLLEEFGASNNCTIESDWQATALKTAGTGGDLFWQWGSTISTGETSQDGNTVYYGDDLYTCLVTNHIAAIDAA